MLKKTFVFISLLSHSFLLYFPLAKKEIGLDNDDICYLKEQNIMYVKACDKGYYCHISTTNSEIGTCSEYEPFYKLYKEECSQDKECKTDLICSDEKVCSLKEEDNLSPYIYIDEVSDEKYKYYYCFDNTYQLILENNVLKCKKSAENSDKCLYENKETYNSDYLKVCGEYSEKKFSISEFAKIEDGKFVGDALACRSGFTLYFYENKQTIPNNPNDEMLQLCVTVKGVKIDKNNEKCFI